MFNFVLIFRSAENTAKTSILAVTRSLAFSTIIIIIICWVSLVVAFFFLENTLHRDNTLNYLTAMSESDAIIFSGIKRSVIRSGSPNSWLIIPSTERRRTLRILQKKRERNVERRYTLVQNWSENTRPFQQLAYYFGGPSAILARYLIHSKCTESHFAFAFGLTPQGMPHCSDGWSTDRRWRHECCRSFG